MKKHTLIVIGAGASGFFCAVNAARIDPNLQVIILEKSSKLLSKVRISGGGRCNVTHDCDEIITMSNRYPRGKNFVKKTFHQFFTKDTEVWFSSRGVDLKTEEDGRRFPVSNSSDSIVHCLITEANTFNVEIMVNIMVEKIDMQDEQFTLSTLRNGKDVLQLKADYICIATGGFPKADQYHWLTALGHTISSPIPSLFTFNLPSHRINALMGITVENAEVKIPALKAKESGPLLITHWGLSGPAILKLSAWSARGLADLQYNFKVVINWIPPYTENSLREYFQSYRLQMATSRMHQKMFGLSQRLWDFIIQESGINDIMRWGDLTTVLQNRLIKLLTNYEVEVKGKTTFKEEFVTAGGISLSEIEPSTMESRRVPNLYFAGEIMDVDGITGGYNFQHAWTSGFIAATSIAAKCMAK
jgi:predicted Rossmann fold flavoprotein